MRPSSYITEPGVRANWRIILSLLPYLSAYRWRVGIALGFLIGAKLANVALPWILKLLVDSLDLQGKEVLVVPVFLLLAYGALRFATVFLGEMRDAIFARVTERTMRRIGLQVFVHIHKLDLDFHLSRKTGGLSRDIERGVSGISFLMRFLLFNILPTLVEIGLVALILYAQFSIDYLFAIIIAVFAYIAFSVLVTEWRTKYVREANEKDSISSTRAVDSLLNYETVKYFNNEQYEQEQYDHNLEEWEKARLKNRISLSFLNSGQGLIIAASVAVLMWMAAQGVVNGAMTLGDFVMVNAYMLQLFIPLNFLGFVYREIRQALINMERMFKLLNVDPKVKDPDSPVSMNVSEMKQIQIQFESIGFAYQPDRPILQDVSFTVEPGQKCAIVGESGAGKSTIAKLLFRFYDVSQGSIKVDNIDLRDMAQGDLRRLFGVVPQDTVLFNDTIEYNIAYGRPGAAFEEIQDAARRAHLLDFIESLPNGWQTKVGERGLKVSGGEKQRIAIARVLLKDPPILIFDEATSALDTEAEQRISHELDGLADRHTSIVIAHRLSTVVNADKIIVLSKGRIVEEGSHKDLLKHAGAYHDLWESQNT